jgi:methyl-accepting chemotaxis protein
MFNVFNNIPTKQKLFINMILAQVGFASITTVAILSNSKLAAIITVNIVFALVVAYTSFSAMQRIVGGIERFRAYMDDLMDFVYMRKNRITKAQYMKNDEIGLILKELNNYVEHFENMRNEDMKVMGEVVLVLDKMSQGVYKCRVNAQSHNFMIRALRDMVNKSLDETEHNMTELNKTLTAYANDDFRGKVKINNYLKADMLEVMNNVNVLGDALSKNAKTGLNNGQTLESNANTMSASVTNLANKANQQAASLEETAAAVEEITSITRNNATNTTTMSQLGTKVKGAVSNGMTLATKTSQAMDSINEQVTAITESITVIDQIAFQTNILSLNAAVEAATAGEAGKGFAVVAQEVRNLASRSADAANDIKTLVENAAQKANEGKKVSDDMIEGYEKLNDNATQTINIIQDVSNASKEQMRGIEQINDTITMLDKVTQENAHEASSVAQIATEVSGMAQTLVADASAKQFN